MERILLLEADYKNKFPPLGLMKIAQYHRSRGDLVFFSKGKVVPLSPTVKNQIRSMPFYQSYFGDGLEKHISRLEDTIRGGQWDRVYVTTLFTFEWKRTTALIEYAKTLTADTSHVFVGGIASTLMPEEYKQATGITPLHGLLTSAEQLGYPDTTCIDGLIPDYSILEHTEYRYPFEDGYFLSATKGCGMRCSFCAVQTLEPDYIPYVPILPRVEEMTRLYDLRRNLYLMDNNVLKSRHFPQIIEDIKMAGFARGATMTNPKTGKQILRHIDFNQGLDMNFLSEKNVKLLSEIALSPCHVAFDHIDDKEKFLRSLTLLEQYDITNICSYMLYNTPDFSGKGKARGADTPQDMFERISVNIEFAERVNERRKAEGKQVFVPFSFPMRYAPLLNKDRAYIGDNWSLKLVRGLNDLYGKTNGGFFPRRATYQMIGKNYEEFYENLLLPKHYIKAHVLDETALAPGDMRYHLCKARAHCLKLLRSLSAQERGVFEALILDNQFLPERLGTVSSVKVRKLYYHYFEKRNLLALVEYGNRHGLGREIREFLRKDCPAVLAATEIALGRQKTGQEVLAALRGLMEEKISA